MIDARRLSLAMVAVAGLFASGCSDEFTCGPGTELKDNVCRPIATGAPDGGETVPDAGGDCVPFCVGRTCGDDGCGGACGSCTDPKAPHCDTSVGQCVAQCVPSCVGRTCGPDGCGGDCGTCSEGASCADFGRCVPAAWTCDALWYGAADTCDCGCGVADPDCALGRPLSGCGLNEVCDAQGACAPRVPAAWTCSVAKYDAGDACDCACGARDPDCDQQSLTVYGCAGDSPTCNADGTCGSCTPTCDGKECGPDGCGGSCGTCGDPAMPACVEGSCVSACDPTPIACLSAKCGDDGCGGSCGTCAENATCQEGNCVTVESPPEPDSCAGNCGSIAPAGCSCTSSCGAAGTCCADYAAQCTCRPQCDGRQCGSDGCGGSCGTCGGETPYCGDNRQCAAACTPQCDGRTCGADGCGGTCGTCGAGSTCAWTGQCVPSAWRCAVSAYADDAGCDCGCGAQDPDCVGAGTFVLGCPTSSTTCSSAGICEVTFCGANAECGSQWCTGTYYRGAGKYAGVCAAPEAAGKGIGQSCAFGGECATGVCAAGRCREYCSSDANCPPEQRCVGLGLRDSAGSPVKGFVGVCEVASGSAAPCTSQATCPSGDACTAAIDPSTLRPRYLCARSEGTSSIGRSCAATACPEGLLCAVVGGSARCTLPCPGGASDCPTSWSCSSVPFHNAGSSDPSDDPTVPVCVPN